MDTLVYLLYGNRPQYQLELTYSVLSAARFLRNEREPRVRFALIAEAHNVRHDLPVENVVVSADEMKRWQLDGRYHFAAKVNATRHALETFGGRVIAIDTDTVFQAHPSKLFEKVGPGRALMHMSEKALSQSLERDDWEVLFAKAGGSALGYELSMQALMYNAGVVGVHESALPLLDDVLRLIVHLHRLHPIFTIEQFAYSAVLDKNLELTTCADEIEHYWGGPRRYYHHQIAQFYPARDAESFQRLAANFPELRSLPPKRLRDRVAGHLMNLRRRDKTYAFAWQAYRSALSEGPDDHAVADIWAGIALDVLVYGVREMPTSINGDFAAFSPGRIHNLPWMTQHTRDRWLKYWRIGQAASTSQRLRASVPPW